MKNNTARVTLETIYSDGSGAPATVLVDGYYFAAEYVCEPRLHSLGNRIAPKRVLNIARHAYEREIKGRVGPDWFALNAAMYAK